jgi:hypothetical protein
MATVNKKFSVKNGLAVDGNVAVSNVNSYTVDGPSSASLTFTLTNVTAATINSNEIVTNAATQTLTNKTIEDAVLKDRISFTNTSDVETMYVEHSGTGTTRIVTTDDLAIRSTDGDIILYPGNESGGIGKVYIGWGNANAATGYGVAGAGNEVATLGDTQVFTNKTINDTLFFTNPSTVPNDGSIVVNDSNENFEITALQADLVLSSTLGDVILGAANGAAYLTSNTAGNEIATQSYVTGLGYLTSESDPTFTASEAYNITSTDTSNWDSAYGWGDHGTVGYLTTAVESIASAGDNNIVFSANTGAVTANLAANVTISQDLTVTGNLTVSGNTTTLNTETLSVEDNVIVLNTNVTGTPTLDAGLEVERGSYTNAKIYWDETNNKWYLSTPVDDANAATNSQIATIADLGSLNDATIISANASATSGAPTIYSWTGATYSTAKFTIQMKQGSDIHVLEILAAIAGSSVYVTEYAEIISNAALGETDVTYDGTDAVLTVTPVAGTVVTKIVATLIEA